MTLPSSVVILVVVKLMSTGVVLSHSYTTPDFAQCQKVQPVIGNAEITSPKDVVVQMKTICMEFDFDGIVKKKAEDDWVNPITPLS